MKIAAEPRERSMISNSVQESSSSVASMTGSVVASLWARITASFSKIRVSRRRALRLCETLSLGEKRLVAVVEFDNQRFLLAATQQNITLLQSLGPAKTEENPAK
jgi:flagellar biogenesis protein FliO